MDQRKIFYILIKENILLEISHRKIECAAMTAKLHIKIHNVNIHCLNQEFALTKKSLALLQ